MSLLPVPEEPLPIVWQNSVVDIEPTSRYGPGGTPDTASVNTTLVLDVSKKGPVTFLAPGHWEEEASARTLGEGAGQRADLVTRDHPDFDGLLQRLRSLQDRITDDTERALGKVKRFHRFTIELDEGSRVLRFFSRLPIVREDDGTYKFSMIVPVEFVRMVKGGDFSVLALLPRDARDYPSPPKYGVKLVKWFKGANARVFGRDKDDLGGRTAVTWTWRVDPVIDLSWLYGD